MKKPNKQAAQRPREIVIRRLEQVRGGAAEGTDSYGGNSTSLLKDDPKQAG